MEGKFHRFISGIFLVALTTLAYEVALSYEFAYIFWFNASIAILSIAMFGLGIGGVIGYFLSKRASNRYYDTLHYSTFIFGVLLFISLYLLTKGSMISFDKFLPSSILLFFRGHELNPVEIFPLLYFSFFASLPFVFSGITLSLGLNYPSPDKKLISYIYFADLVGAGIGSFLIITLLQFLSLEGILTLCSVLTLFSSLFFVADLNLKKFLPILVTGSIVVLIFSAYPSSFTPEVSGYKWLAKEKARGGEVIASQWGAVSRIDVISRNNRIWMIENGVTPVEVSRGNINLASLRKDPRYFMFEVFNSSPQNMLAIGSGGGVELTMALNAGLKNITAVEINPLILDFMTNDFAEYSQGLFFNPSITNVIEDGRTYVHRSEAKYDLIENGVVGAAGLFVPSSRVLNFMYAYVFTEEANQEYWRHLSEDGVALTIIYVLLDDYNSIDADRGVSYHLVRQFNTVNAALEKEGIDAKKHMIIFQFHPDGGPELNKYQGEYTFLFKKELTSERVTEIINKASNYGFKPAYAPYYSSSIDLEKYSSTIPKERTVTSVTDDKPFFYHIEKNEPKVLGQLLLILGAMTFTFILLPVIIGQGYRLQHLMNYPLLVYFLCLGVAYILIEAVLIQKLSLFLGRPAYTFQVVLFSMLMFSGFGSFLSARIQDDNLFKVSPILLIITFSAVLVYTFLTPKVIYSYMQYTLLSKVLVSIIFLAPLAVVMGMPFPMGLRITSIFSKHDVVWMYALNSAGSVLGSLIGMMIAFNFGYSYSLSIGGVVYLLAFFALLIAIRISPK